MRRQCSSQAKKDKNDAALAVASIIKVIAMLTLTDAYGDVPYFEALQGYTSGGTEFTPRYDSQKEIYRDMFRLLEEANTLLAQSKENFDASEDYMYKGDIKKWRKLGNSIYLRLLMRAALKDEVDVETESLFAVSKLNQIFSYPAGLPISRAAKTLPMCLSTMRWPPSRRRSSRGVPAAGTAI